LAVLTGELPGRHVVVDWNALMGNAILLGPPGVRPDQRQQAVVEALMEQCVKVFFWN
jgi:hypothetical protein